MFILHIISFLVIVIAAGYLLRADLGDMLPFVWCGIVLVLYALAFGRHLEYIDICMPAAACLLLAAAVISRHRRGGPAGYVRESLCSAPFAVYLLLCVLIPFCMAEKTVTWWDDVNYWASDLKSIYYMGGFASKYANVSPSFGDYPPAVQLAKWYLTHMDRSGFREDLAFTGYYLFNLSFLMPLYRRIKGKGLWMAIPLAAVTWFIPGIAEIYGYAGFCADLSMAMLFGNILIAAFDVNEEGRSGLFGILRIMLFSSVLVLTKSTGAIWALFGLTVWYVSALLRTEKLTVSKALRTLLPAAAPFVTGCSWLGFCLMRHRVTQTTSTMVTYITTDRYGLSGYTGQFAAAFIKAFFTEPLHMDRVWIDLPPAAFFLLLCLGFFLLYRKGYLRDKAGRFTAVCLPVMGVLYYAVIFLAHITIFGSETQYLEPSGMIASIERYGAPFMLGCTVFTGWLWMNGKEDAAAADAAERTDTHKGDPRWEIYVKTAVLAAAVMLLTNIPAAWDGVWGYRTHAAEDMDARNAYVDESGEKFIEAVKEAFPVGNTRVCRLRDGGYYRVDDTYTAYEASPVSVISISYALDSTDAGTLINAVDQTHASYLYADEQQSGKKLLDDMTSGGSFEYGRIYRISFEGGGMVLYPIY